MEVVLPKYLGTRDLPRLYEVCGKVLATDDAEIILDASEVEFIEPHGLAVLGALLSPLDGRRISMPWLPVELAGYLDRMDFFKYCTIEAVQKPEWNRYPHPFKLVELTCLTDSSDVDSLAERLADAIAGQMTTANPSDPLDDTGKNKYHRFRHPVWYSLSELLANAVTHAKMHGHPRAQVWVAAQFYEQNGEVKLSVVDNGCGMLRTLRTHPELHGEQTHLAAIRAALRPKVSCNRESASLSSIGHGNQGVGLTTTMKIATAAKGRLMIATGTGYLETGEMRGQVLPNNGRWDGVAIALSLRRSALPSVQVRHLIPVEVPDAPIPLQFVDK